MCMHLLCGHWSGSQTYIRMLGNGLFGAVVDVLVGDDEVRQREEQARERDGQRVKEVALDLLQVEVDDDQVGVRPGDVAGEVGVLGPISIQKIFTVHIGRVAAALDVRKQFARGRGPLRVDPARVNPGEFVFHQDFPASINRFCATFLAGRPITERSACRKFGAFSVTNGHHFSARAARAGTGGHGQAF